MAATSILGAWLATVIPIEWANPLLAALIVYAVIQLAVRTAQSTRRG
jgi:hypothetical protein